MLSKEELKKDIGELLDYLHTTPEKEWDLGLIMKRMKENFERFNQNIKYYNTPTETKEYIKLVYSREDFKDLIKSLTEKYVSINMIELKQEYHQKGTK